MYLPVLLTDKTRLQEIYNLRVDVWEDTAKSEFVNRQLFPDGWVDNLDEAGHNFVVTSDETIIASARLNLFNSPADFPFYKEIMHVRPPKSSPFGYYSRLVVSQGYRGNCISRNLDDSIIDLAIKLELKWIIGLSSERTDFMIKKLGFINYGTANIRYHKNSGLHLINVIIKHL